MSAAVRARSSGALVVKQVSTPVKVDDFVSWVRRAVERVLPWFDAKEYHEEAARQEAVIHDAEVTSDRSRRTLEAYEKAHRGRR